MLLWLLPSNLPPTLEITGSPSGGPFFPSEVPKSHGLPMRKARFCASKSYGLPMRKPTFEAQKVMGCLCIKANPMG